MAAIFEACSDPRPKVENQNDIYEMENTPSPSIGRIVVYNHPGSADGKFAPKQSPAMVQKVNDDGTVEMIVFSVYGGIFFNHAVSQGDGPSQWNWPARV
jgi:hypothetical protein